MPLVEEKIEVHARLLRAWNRGDDTAAETAENELDGLTARAAKLKIEYRRTHPPKPRYSSP